MCFRRRSVVQHTTIVGFVTQSALVRYYRIWKETLDLTALAAQPDHHHPWHLLSSPVTIGTQTYFSNGEIAADSHGSTSRSGG